MKHIATISVSLGDGDTLVLDAYAKDEGGLVLHTTYAPTAEDDMRASDVAAVGAAFLAMLTDPSIVRKDASTYALMN